mgnify:FL=1
MNFFQYLVGVWAAVGMIPVLAASDSPWGIMSHPFWSRTPEEFKNEIKMTSEAGAKWMRTDFGFGMICKEPGKFDFSRSDKLVEELAAKGIQVLPVLEGYDWEIRPECRPLYKYPEEWRNYVRAVAEHYKGRIHAYEIWNEQDGGFWRPAPNAAQYVRRSIRARL